MKRIVNKTVQLSLLGLEENAIAMLVAFRTQALREDWTEEEIKLVIHHAMAGDHHHLLAVIQAHCKP